MLLVGLLTAPSALARPDSVFLIGDRERPQRVVVTIGDHLDRPGAPTSEMVGLLDGVVADLTGAELAQFLGTPMPRTKLLDARGNLERLGVAHLIGKTGVKRVELFAGNEGVFLAQEMEGEKEGKSPRVAKLNPDRFRSLLLHWPRYRGAILAKDSSEGTGNLVIGKQFELEKPYLQGPFYLDSATLTERFMHGGKSQVTPVARVLQDETMYVRLPRGYDPKRPAGLLVWVSAEQAGGLPQVFEGALDELGIIGVGIKNVGNDREPAARFQLPIDAVWTVSRCYHIDPRRVYLTGISGGGRIVSRLLICFPDYFTGGVPIVGVDSYFNIPLGNGRYLPAWYRRPENKLWALVKKHHISVITGDRDMNAFEIRESAKQMNSDGLGVKVFDYKNFGHQMPSGAQFREALMWADEPYQQEHQKEEAAAKAALEKFLAKYGKRAPADDKQRAELVRVTEAGAWTDAAWEAVDLLRAVTPNEK